MTLHSDPCEACTSCIGCGRTWCRAWTTSPGEADGLCVECAPSDPEEAAA